MLSLYKLPNQIEGEETLRVVRMDIFVFLTRIIFFALLLLLPLGFYLVAKIAWPGLLSHPVMLPALLLSASAYYLFACLFFFFSFIDYYLDVWIITSERIVDIQQRGLFSRVVSEQKLSRVQDVTSEVHGVMPTLFRYGNVHVQTAGAKERFFFDRVPDPEGVRDMIIRLAREKQKQGEQ